MDLHLGGEESLIVKGNILFRDDVEDKLQIEGAAVVQQVAHADIALVTAESEVDLRVAARLFGGVAQRIERAGAHPIDIGQIQPLLHQVIQHTGSIDAAEAAALQHQGGILQVRFFHSSHPFSYSISLPPIVPFPAAQIKG